MLSVFKSVCLGILSLTNQDFIKKHNSSFDTLADEYMNKMR